MKVYKSCPEEDINHRFKPIKINLPEWPLGPSIVQILDKKENNSNETIYVVKTKDNQVTKIAEENLSKNYIDLINQYRNDSQKDTIPVKRGRMYQRSFEENKKPKTSPKFDVESNRDTIEESDQESFQSDSDNSEDHSMDTDFAESDPGSNSVSEQRTTTQHGRRTVKPKSYLDEFHSKMYNDTPTKLKKLGKTHFGPVHKIPLYEDQSFIEQHSEYCFQCHRKGYINGRNDDNTDVYIGIDNARSRLLLCDYCSLSFHNNCVSLLSTNYDKETQQLKCQKCIKSTKCSGCGKLTLTKNKSEQTSFRCSSCFRNFHKDCIIPNVSTELKDSVDDNMLHDMYLSGKCVECNEYESKRAEVILAERLSVDKLEYFIKWKDLSYRKATWVSADWISHMFQTLRRAYLTKKENGKTSPYSEEWLLIDRIINVKWENKSAKIAKKVLAIFKDRDYAEACWDEPPPREDKNAYAEYKKALNRYIKAMDVEPSKNTKALITQVRSKATSESYEKHELKKQPKFITGGTLMKHQMEALNWLLYQWENHQSCILADDMGLGKTIQIISFLYYLFKKYNIYPFYIVVPNSTATNWIREFEKWAPEMTVAPYYGGAVARRLSLENEVFDKYNRVRCHVVVATYETALESTLAKTFWPVMIVDESQRLKNDNSLLFKHLTKMRVDHTVLLTGTPLQNNLRELFNIMHFIHPEAFDGSEAEEYEDLTAAQVEELHSRLRPFFLRRTKEEVLKTLPPKYELIVPVSMTSLQKEVYKQCLSGEIQETLSQATMAKRQQGLTNIFTNLRKVLNHPYLLDGVEASQTSPEMIQNNMIQAGAKLKLFHQMLPKLIERGHRMLIFSTMTRTLDVLEDYLTHEKVKYARIDGRTTERSRVRAIDAFNAPDSELKVFLLSTRAGGVGINLATADTVIIWDSDFNPNADLQAIGRAHRIGQTKMVLIYRLMTRYSVEEKVLQIAKKRIALEHVVVERMKETQDDELEDIESILKYGTEALFSDDNSKDIVYDNAAVENLLDREQYRVTATEQQQKEVEEMEGKANEKGAMNFSFAKVWKSDGTTEELGGEAGTADEQKDTDFWEQFLLEQQAALEKKKEEKRLAQMNLGRGARKKAVVTYNETEMTNERTGLKKTKKKVDEDIDFVAEASDSDSSVDALQSDKIADLVELIDKLDKSQTDQTTGSKEKENSHPPQQSAPGVPSSGNAQAQSKLPESLRKIMNHSPSPEIDQDKKKAQQHLRDMEQRLKEYDNSLYGLLISFIDKDIKHIQAQEDVALISNTFSLDVFRQTRPLLIEQIQKSITDFSIATADRDRVIDIQRGIDHQLAMEVFESKKRIIARRVPQTTEYLLDEFKKLEKYAEFILNQREATRRNQLQRLKAEILHQREEEAKLKEKFLAEERKMKLKHKKLIIELSKMYNLYPDGIPPGPNADMDTVTDRLIEQVLNMDFSSPPTTNIPTPPKQPPTLSYPGRSNHPKSPTINAPQQPVRMMKTASFASKNHKKNNVPTFDVSTLKIQQSALQQSGAQLSNVGVNNVQPSNTQSNNTGSNNAQPNNLQANSAQSNATQPNIVHPKNVQPTIVENLNVQLPKTT